ncbi:MAG: acyltransferase family protein [Polyangiales bacterium]
MNDRWRALDLLRFVAVVLMVQGHVFGELLDPSLRQGPWFLRHAYIHGLTAPMFFFSSGLAFGVATFGHWPLHTHWGPAMKRRFGRYGWLLFIGYMLSLPGLSFHYLLTSVSAETTRVFFGVDALRNIAAALAVIQGLVWLTKKQRPFIATVAALGVVLVFGAPSVWRLPVEQWLPIGIAAYVNVDTGSIFPLFPWMGFICAGVVAAYLSVDRQGLGFKGRRALGFATVGFVLWLVAHQLQESGVNPFGEHVYWKTSPIFFFTRLGLILLGFAVLCAYETYWSRPRERDDVQGNPEKGHLLQRIGQETLVIYVVHLIVLYGSPLHRGLTAPYEATLGIGAASVVAVLVLIVSTAVALGWASARQRWPERFRLLQYALAATVLLIALVKP